MRENKLVFHSVNYSFEQNGKFIIKDLTLAIQEKSITSIIGKNGSGKTTLLLLMLGFLKPSTGSVHYFSDNRAKEVSDHHGNIAYLPQNEDIPHKLTVDEMLLLGRLPFTATFGNPGEIDIARVDTVKKQLGLENLGNKRLNQISGGELQRVRIGRALSQEADLILLDEPITHLDLETKYKIMEIIEMLRHSGKTIIFSTHDPLEAIQIADNAILISADQKIDFGAADDVLEEKKLSNCLGVQIEVGELHKRRFILVNN